MAVRARVTSPIRGGRGGDPIAGDADTPHASAKPPASQDPSGDVPRWGELRPRRTSAWEEEGGRVALICPRFGNGWLGRRLESTFHPKPYRVHLDEVGTFIWKRCDGSTTVEDLARAMRGELGEKVEPVEDRLVTFLRSLQRGRFITLR